MEKLNDFSKGDNNFNLFSLNKLKNLTRLHKVSNLKDNNMEPQILLETISYDLRTLEQRIDSLQKNQALLRKDLIEAGVLKLKI